MQLAPLVVGSTLALTLTAQPALSAFLAPGEVVTWQHDNGGLVRLDGELVPFGSSFELGAGSTLEIGTGFTSLSLLSLPGTEDIEFTVQLLPSNSYSSISGPDGFNLSANIDEGASTQVTLGDGSFTSIAYGDREGFARAVITPTTEAVPEPLTILGSLAALGFGMVLKLKGNKVVDA